MVPRQVRTLIKSQSQALRASGQRQPGLGDDLNVGEVVDSQSDMDPVRLPRAVS